MSEPLGKVIPFRRKEAKTEGAQSPVTFKEFTQFILVNDLNAAAETLTKLFAVPKDLALKCASAFHHKAQSDPELFPRTVQLREYLEAGETNRALETLGICFDVYGLEALQVLTGLNAKFGKTESK